MKQKQSDSEQPCYNNLFQHKVFLQRIIDSGYFDPLEELYVVSTWNGVVHVNDSYLFALGNIEFFEFIRKLKRKIKRCLDFVSDKF